MALAKLNHFFQQNGIVLVIIFKHYSVMSLPAWNLTTIFPRLSYKFIEILRVGQVGIVSNVGVAAFLHGRIFRDDFVHVSHCAVNVWWKISPQLLLAALDK